MSIVWFDEVTLTAEIALSAATGTYGAWGAGTWGASLWGPGIVYVDLSNRLRAFKTDRQFAEQVQWWQTGTASMVLSNRDAALSPDNLTGPYAVAGVSGVVPWRPARLTATFNGVAYPLFGGYELDFVDTWLPGHADAYVTVPLVDEFGALAEVDGEETSVQGAGETSGRRINRILDATGHTGDRAIDDGRITVQATTLESDPTNELKLTVDSEGGGIFVDPAGVNGTIVFEEEYALLENDRSRVVQATFGDGSSAAELPCSDVTPVSGGDRIKNYVSFTRVGGTAQVVTDETSRSQFRTKKQVRTDLICETDAQVLALAEWYLAQYRSPAKRFSRIQVKPRKDPDVLFPVVLGLRMRDLVAVTARPIGGITITRYCHVAGVHHDVDGDDWVTTFDLWNADVYVEHADSLWGVGLWGSATWFF